MGNVIGGSSGGDGHGDGDSRAADTWVLLDTMLLSSYMQCSPPRHSALVSGGAGGGAGMVLERKGSWLGPSC